jgi:hypothetical protein
MPVVRVGREHLTLVALSLNPSPNSGRGTLILPPFSVKQNGEASAFIPLEGGTRAICKTEIHPVEKLTYGFTNHLGLLYQLLTINY